MKSKSKQASEFQPENKQKTPLTQTSGFCNPLATPEEKASSIRDQFQTNEHEMHQMVPIVKEHVAQQSTQVIEELFAGN